MVRRRAMEQAAAQLVGRPRMRTAAVGGDTAERKKREKLIRVVYDLGIFDEG